MEYYLLPRKTELLDIIVFGVLGYGEIHTEHDQEVLNSGTTLIEKKNYVCK